jgi:hypothetical protein
MPRVREVKLCRYCVPAGELHDPITGEPYPAVAPCEAPATRDGFPNCSHGRTAREWVATFAPKGTA